MSNMNEADVAALFKETYSDAIPSMFEAHNSFAARVKTRGNVIKFGPRSLRLPKKMANGGKGGFFDIDGGSLGRGNGAQYEAATMTPVFYRVAVEYTRAVDLLTANNTIAVRDAARDLIKDGFTEFMVLTDKLLNTADAILATISSGAGTTTVVMTSPFGVRRLRNLNSYISYQSDLSAPRDNGSTWQVTEWDPINLTIERDVFPAGEQNGDVVVSEGSSGADPATINGLYYHMDSAATGSWMGIDRADFPQVRTPEVVAGGFYTASMARLAQNLAIGERSDDMFDTGSWVIYGGYAQKQAIEDSMLNIAEYHMEGKNDGGVSTNIEKIMPLGMKTLYSPNADPTRLDFVDFDNWGRGESVPLGIYTVGESKLFPIYSAADGGIVTANIFYLTHGCQYFVNDPGRGAYISSLSMPDGYPN